MSTNDFKLKMNLLKNNRSTRTDDIAAFNQLRHTFAAISEKYANQRTNSTLKSTLGNRVTFKQDIVDDSNIINTQQNYNSPISTLVSSVLNQPKSQTHQASRPSGGSSNSNKVRENAGLSALISGAISNQHSQNNNYKNDNRNLDER